MADRKISELTNITGANLADDDEFALVDTSADETKAITFGEFKTALDTATGFVRITGDTMTGNLTVPNVVVSGNVDGRDVSADGTKLDGIEAGADVTDTTNVTAAGALMDSELSNLAAVKAINQGLSTSDSPSFDAVTVGSTSDPSSEMTILSSIGGTSELRLGDTDADAGSIKYFNSNDQLVLRAAAATRVIFSSTGAAITGKTTTDELDLNAIAATISDTAVDIFVYDTRKDSDGGAWRKRTQHTSWYNETLNTATRGSRKEFPSVAVIVAESTQLTIYDGDDPDLPMWMVFNTSGSDNMLRLNASNITSLFTVNATLTVSSSGTYGMTSVINFISDESDAWYSQHHKYKGNIEQRNDALGFITISTSGLVSEYANDVAMTVLPNAPIDAATGLPVPTIAVATDGGVSVIKDDGTVVDLTTTQGASYNYSGFVGFESSTNKLLFGMDSSSRTDTRRVHYQEIPTADKTFSVNGNSADELFARGGSGGNNGSYPEVVADADISKYEEFALAGASGLTLVDRPDVSSVFVTSSYNTGYQVGAIKLATLSDTDATNVTGAELVTNGDFSSALGAEWDLSTGSGTIAIVSGQLEITQGSYSSIMYAAQDFATVSGKTYTVSFKVVATTEANYFRVKVGTSANATDLGVTSTLTAAGEYSITFTATGSTSWVTLHSDQNANKKTTWDNISVRLAEEDRSVNGNGLQVFGTVTKSAVATGADLVGYSGFSASNYLEQPYNSDLDFGTGDFCVMGWVKRASGTYATGVLLGRKDSSNTDGYVIFTDASNNTNFYTREGTVNSVLTSSFNVSDGTWHHITAVRTSSGTVQLLYIDGRLVQSASVTARNVSNSTAKCRLGLEAENTNAPFTSGSLALWRISATAPSPEQIAKIYEDEKFLFQENAQATLYGSSDAVTALAYDDSTELLHAGTSAGRSVFQGLRRVDNTTTAVGAAISASNGLVADE